MTRVEHGWLEQHDKLDRCQVSISLLTGLGRLDRCMPVMPMHERFKDLLQLVLHLGGHVASEGGGPDDKSFAAL